jgi:hypothetical protein
MLDVNDFIKERGGDPDKIRDSQRRRFAPVEVVDEIITLFEDHRKGMFCPFRDYNHLFKADTLCSQLLRKSTEFDNQ